MGKIIRELKGHSGCQIYLMESDRLYVKKTGNVERNVNQLRVLDSHGFPVPKVYNYFDGTLEMEYLHGLDIKNYLLHHNTKELVTFVSNILDKFSESSESKDYTETYLEKLDWIKDGQFPFTKESLFNKLPKILPKTLYHGDMTLENIMYTDSGFYMIDTVTTEYDSYIFDIAKMRQDLECKWFLRNSDARLNTKLQNIQDSLKKKYSFAFDDSLLILMLLRVIRYCKEGDANYNFLMKEINRLWK